MAPFNEIKLEIDSLSPAGTHGRRGFITGLLASSFALAEPVIAQTVIRTPDAGLLADEVAIPAGDIEMAAYRAQPAKGGPFPVVLVVQEIFGVHAWVQDICRRFAQAGYLAIAPSLYQRQGDPTKETSIPELMSKIVARVPDAQVMRDLDATAAWALRNGGTAGRLAITGFCWGGRITWLYAAHNPSLRAAVAWYGRLVGPSSELTPIQPVDIAARLKVPVLGLYGGKDKGIPLESIEQMRAVIKTAGGASELKVFDDAEHGFMADYRPSYSPAASAQAWPAALAWFKRYGV